MTDRSPYRAAAPPTGHRCPRCPGPLYLRGDDIGETPVHRCSRCDGVWVARSAFRDVVQDLDRQSEIAALLGPGEAYVDEVKYLRCAECDRHMARLNFGRRSGVIVDQCPEHGIWFDAGELAAAVDFLIRRGPEPEPPEKPPRPAPPPSHPLFQPVPLERQHGLLAIALEAIADFLIWL